MLSDWRTRVSRFSRPSLVLSVTGQAVMPLSSASRVACSLENTRYKTISQASIKILPYRLPFGHSVEIFRLNSTCSIGNLGPHAAFGEVLISGRFMSIVQSSWLCIYILFAARVDLASKVTIFSRHIYSSTKLIRRLYPHIQSAYHISCWDLRGCHWRKQRLLYGVCFR